MARLLIVEPHADVARSFALVCEMWGHEVATAADGEEALALVAAFGPDVVLIDFGLSDRSVDTELVHRIRAMDHDGVFIIALIGFGPIGERAIALRAGANACFLKPPDLDQLQRTIERATGKVSKRDAS